MYEKQAIAFLTTAPADPEKRRKWASSLQSFEEESHLPDFLRGVRNELEADCQDTTMGMRRLHLYTLYSEYTNSLLRIFHDDIKNSESED